MGVHYLRNVEYETVGACIESDFTDKPANARAIAALPDLLVALEAIESTLAGHPESGTGNTKVHYAMHAARTALTKAGYTF